MKILIDGRDLLIGRTVGNSRFLKNIIPGILAAKPDWKIVLLLNQYCEYFFSSPNLIKETVNETITQVTDQIIIPKIVKKHKIDVFFSPYYKCPFFCKANKIIVIHDMIGFTSYNSFNVSKYIFTFLMAVYSRAADEIITVSEYSKKDIAKLLFLNPKKIKALLNYNSVAEEFSPRTENEISAVIEKYKLTAPYILYVGNSRKHKNIERLIKAFEQLPEEISKTHYLVLAGVRTNEITTKIPERCRIIEHVDEKSLPALYSGAKVFVFPSIYEGFGLPPLEAMACGVPVITSNASAIPEVLGDTASLVDPYNVEDIKNSIIKLLHDDAYRKLLIGKGFKRVEMFTISKSVKALIEMFEEINSRLSNKG